MKYTLLSCNMKEKTNSTMQKVGKVLKEDFVSFMSGKNNTK
jgi:hypothetical protein